MSHPSDIERTLNSSGFPFKLLENRCKIRSSAEGAAYWGIDIGSTAPALVLRAGEAYLLLIVSGAVRKVDFEALARETGSSGLRLAAPNEIRERFGLKPGEVPLFGLEITTMVDRRLMAYDFVYGGSGDPGFTLKIAPGALLVLNGNSCLVDVPCLVEESGKGGI